MISLTAITLATVLGEFLSSPGWIAGMEFSFWVDVGDTDALVRKAFSSSVSVSHSGVLSAFQKIANSRSMASVAQGFFVCFDILGSQVSGKMKRVLPSYTASGQL